MLTKRHLKEKVLKCTGINFYGIVSLIVLLVIARANYLLFHTAVESFSIIVSVLIYVLATNTYRYSNSNYLLFLGYAYLFIGILDFFHMVTYSGMNILTFSNTDVATQFWIAGRYIEAISLLAGPYFIRNRLPVYAILGGYTLAIAFFIVTIMWVKVFPHCFIEQVGLTTFKIVSEYVISLTIFMAIFHLRTYRSQISPSLYTTQIYAMALAMMADFLFTFYVDVYGWINFTGHILVIASTLFIYKGVILHGFKAPYDTIFNDLKVSTITDSLTGLYNRQGFMEMATLEIRSAKRGGYLLEVLMIDIDKFKTVNDKYGHLIGDRVLRQFSAIVKDLIKGKQIVCRLGGDEFVVMLDKRESGEFKQKLREKIRDWKKWEEEVAEIDISIGSALWKPGDSENIFALLNEADEKMYSEKNTKTYSRSQIPGE